jgi:hypothetical protein
MHKSTTMILIAIVVACCLATSASAQSSGRASSNTDRLFLSFIEDATIVERQWWEIQVATAEWDPGLLDYDETTATGVAAFQPLVDWEFGGRVGFGKTDGNDGFSDGSGATDLDVWGKYHLGGSDETEWAVGGVLTVPTGDDGAGLGLDAFAGSAFGAVRHRMENVILAAHVGLQINGDGQFRGSPEFDGEVSPQLGVGAIVPFSDSVSGVFEAAYRGSRLDAPADRFDDDIRALGGINWRPGGRGMIRAAVGVGISDGAPDIMVQAGYAAQF